MQKILQCPLRIKSSRILAVRNSFRNFNASIDQNDIYHRDYGHNEQRMAPIYRICFTGGPCAGKTTAIAQLQDQISDKGYRVFTVPEAASLLMKSGAMIDNQKLTEDQRFNL